MHIYKTIAKIIPAGLRKKIQKGMVYAGITIDSEDFTGFVTMATLMIGAILGFFLGPFYDKPFWMFFVGTIVVLNLFVYVWLILMVDKKAQLIEESLPDALQLTASNLRAGSTPDRALLLSARPEFGPLKDEIDTIGKKVALGSDMGEALREMTKRVKSRALSRAVELINSGLMSGGSLSILLEATANNLREQFLVGKKIRASITMYLIFIFAAAAIISPVLFGFSSFLVEILKSSLSTIDVPSTAVASFPLRITDSGITNEFMMLFVLVFLIGNCFMASQLLGLIVKGRQREGFKYFLPMLLLAIPLFLLSRFMISQALGGLFDI